MEEGNREEAERSSKRRKRIWEEGKPERWLIYK
jgi:hypothetical protein